MKYNFVIWFLLQLYNSKILKIECLIETKNSKITLYTYIVVLFIKIRTYDKTMQFF